MGFYRNDKWVPEPTDYEGGVADPPGLRKKQHGEQIERLQAELASANRRLDVAEKIIVELREALDLVEDMIKGQIDYRVGCSPSEILRKIEAAREKGNG